MNKSRIVFYFGLMIVVSTTLLVWYSDFNTKHIHNHSEEKYLTDVEANKIVVSFDDSKDYYYETLSLVESSKTLVPFIYSKTVLSLSKPVLRQKDSKR